jgi:hypothetical protein
MYGFHKPFKLFAVDTDTGEPVNPNVRKRVRYRYEVRDTTTKGSKQVNAKENEAKPTAEKKKDKGAKDSDDADWTDEKDATLKAMKGEGKSWAMIGEAMEKSKEQLQARWKEIKPDGFDAQAHVGKEAKQGKQKKNSKDKKK